MLVALLREYYYGIRSSSERSYQWYLREGESRVKLGVWITRTTV
jgi:hypothetical protein